MPSPGKKENHGKKRIYEFCLSIGVIVLSKTARIIPDRHRKAFFTRLIQYFAQVLSKASPYYVSIVTRPKIPTNVPTGPSKPNLREQDTAIVVQGPIVTDDQFTKNTLLLYRRLHPEAKLILSTWDDQENQAREIKAITGCETVLSAKPGFFGNSNVNLQLVSAQAGIQCALELGCKFVLKSRSDQRLYSQYALSFLRAILEQHPVQEQGFLKGRLVSLACGTRLLVPLIVSDFLTFGYAEDVSFFWSAPLQLEKNIHIHGSQPPELYLTQALIQRMKINTEPSMENHWQILQKYFCLVNRSQLDLFWKKYDSWNENRLEPHVLAHYEANSDMDCFTHEFWQILQKNQALPALKSEQWEPIFLSNWNRFGTGMTERP